MRDDARFVAAERELGLQPRDREQGEARGEAIALARVGLDVDRAGVDADRLDAFGTGELGRQATSPAISGGSGVASSRSRQATSAARAHARAASPGWTLR